MFFSEAIKAMGSMSDILYTPNINLASYTVVDAAMDATTQATKHSGNGIIGIDLENFPSANKSSIFAGMNVNNDDIYFVGTFKTGTTVGNHRFDGFALYDSIIIFENNTCYRKF